MKRYQKFLGLEVMPLGMTDGDSGLGAKSERFDIARAVKVEGGVVGRCVAPNTK